MNGVVYVACGVNAIREATESIRTLKNLHRYPVEMIKDEADGMPGRWAKTKLFSLSPFDFTLFLDADTRIHGDVSWGFKALADGWDLIMVPSKITDKPLHNLDENEQIVTLKELGNTFPLMLNTGVMWFRKNERVGRLFSEWHTEWLRWKRHDQGAFLRALMRTPVKLFIAGRPFNGGEVIEHLFGRAKP